MLLSRRKGSRSLLSRKAFPFLAVFFQRTFMIMRRRIKPFQKR